MLNQNLFKVVTWKESGENEKCPRCLNIRQDFMEIMPNVWGCYQCGCVFVPKAVRYKELQGKKEQVAKQDEEKVAPVIPVTEQNHVVISEDPEPEPEFKCEICGKAWAATTIGYANKELEGKREQIKLQEAKKEDAPAPVSAEEIKEILAEPEPEWKCEVCGKVCGSKAGLAAHMRSHS